MEALHDAIKGLSEVTARQLQEAPSLKFVLAVIHAKQTGSPLDTDCIICLHDALLNFRKLSEEEIISIIKKGSMKKERIFNLKGTRNFRWKAKRVNNDSLTDAIAEEWIAYNPAVLQNLELTPRSFRRAAEMKVPKDSLLFWGKRSGIEEAEVLEMLENLSKKKEEPEAAAEVPQEPSPSPQEPEKPKRKATINRKK